jgi:alanine dehydrogenase
VPILFGFQPHEKNCSRGLFAIDDVYTIHGVLVTGKKEGRQGKDVITVFDSTGVAIEDIATAKLVYEKAKQVGSYTYADPI